MKKITILLFAAITLASCGGGSTTTVPATDSTVVAVDTTKVVADTAKLTPVAPVEVTPAVAPVAPVKK